jgi:hypothetical protein
MYKEEEEGKKVECCLLYYVYIYLRGREDGGRLVYKETERDKRVGGS